ncbi:hypothetical protein LguiB_013670 [Lonicera macranthoides]
MNFTSRFQIVEFVADSSQKNNLTSSIPATFGNSTQLRELDLSSNHLVGEIPKEFGELNYLLKLLLTTLWLYTSRIHITERVVVSHLSSNSLKISSKNVLPDSGYEGNVFDFGTTKFLKLNLSNWSTLASHMDMLHQPKMFWVNACNYDNNSSPLKDSHFINTPSPSHSLSFPYTIFWTAGRVPGTFKPPDRWQPSGEFSPAAKKNPSPSVSGKDHKHAGTGHLYLDHGV